MDADAGNQSKLTSRDHLRNIYPDPKGAALDKQLDALDSHCRDFIAQSPFLVLGTVGDVSPKGDHPGFVQVLDERTLVIPDRKGNNRLDSFENIVDDNRVALIFFVPGMNETLRVNGRGELSADSNLLETMSLNGNPPQAALIIHVEEAYLHCAKALLRSKLWDSENLVKKGDLATGPEMLAAHAGNDPAEQVSRYEKNMQAMLEEEGRE